MDSVKLTFPAVLAVLLFAASARAQTTVFTYQGRLETNGAPANGTYDLRFTLHDASSGGNQVGAPLTNSPVGVANGLFVVTLDFGSNAFNGGARWLHIGVRGFGDAGNFTPLSPRQAITSVPYAVRALNAGSASNLLAALPATNLSGTLPDARLSTNVALLNASNAAFLGSISATNFYGYGGGLTNVPGRIFEVIPTAANIQAFANFGYLATNSSMAVVVTLPATANIRVGETIRVSGSGAAGWVVAQNAGQSILVANLLNSVGFNWTSNGGSFTWKAIASSADGSRLVAVINGGQVYTSANQGATWAAQGSAGSRNWSSVASSADGLKLAAAVNTGFIYTSTDGGTNWSQRAASRSWTGIASSLDGSRLSACATGAGGGVYLSTDSGVNWPASPSLAAATYTGVASSGNGSNLVATISGGQIWVSANAGASWNNRASSSGWTCVAASVDGGTLVAGANAGANYLHVSMDYGLSWVPGSIGAAWAGVGCSADGARMIAVANSGGVYVSLDSGVTWLLRGSLPTAIIYNGAACSGDGATMAAVATANPIYVSSKSSTTVGTAGQLIGSRLAAVELQHVGNGVFIPISYAGTIRAK